MRIVYSTGCLVGRSNLKKCPLHRTLNIKCSRDKDRGNKTMWQRSAMTPLYVGLIMEETVLVVQNYSLVLSINKHTAFFSDLCKLGDVGSSGRDNSPFGISNYYCA